MQTGYFILLFLIVVFIISLIFIIRSKKLKRFRNNLKNEQEVRFLDLDMFMQNGTVAGFGHRNEILKIKGRDGNSYTVERKYVYPLKKKNN
jgi:hypothetical protein